MLHKMLAILASGDIQAMESNIHQSHWFGDGPVSPRRQSHWAGGHCDIFPAAKDMPLVEIASEIPGV